MTRTFLALAVAFALGSGPALADHSHGDESPGHALMGDMLASSTPADGAVLAQAPRTLALTFAHPVTLQTVAITGPEGAPVAATFRRPASPVAGYTIALPALAAGAYHAHWTATGMGHRMEGVLSFVIR